MPTTTPKFQFETQLLCPAKPGKESPWTFLILPKTASDTLPRRGRTTIEGTLNGHPFQATLEPDGKFSHWLKVPEELRTAANAQPGDTVSLEITPIQQEPEPDMPADLHEALSTSPEAMETWNATTTIARVDWIHWLDSAKQAKTRARRIENALDMLASGDKRVCCFDSSGAYSKSLCAPKPLD